MKVLLLINPASRSASQLRDEIVNTLTSDGHVIINQDFHEEIPDPNELIYCYKDSAEAIVVAGGDGSVNIVLPALKETRIPLLVIPCGTANNLARHYDLSNNVKENIGLLNKGRTIEIDLGEVNKIPFVNVAGLGLSTEVNRKVSKRLKQHFGVFAFVFTAIQLSTKMNPFRAIITTDKKIALPTKSWQISVCNGKHYGAGMTIKHNASLHDGKLHLLSTEVKKWWKAATLVRSFFSGHYNKDQDITLLSARELTIVTRRKFHIDVDGDIKTTTPATFRVLPKAVKLFVPEI